MQSEKLRPFHESIIDELKSPVLYLRSEKQQMAVGALATLLGLVQKTEIPKAHLLSVIDACDYVKFDHNVVR